MSKKPVVFLSPGYNFVFDPNDGRFVRWGKTYRPEDDPKFSPFGPEIIDMEISTICHGIMNKPCTFCYKSNSGNGKNMSFDTFKAIFDKLPKTVTQIAFGIGDIDANPDLWKIMVYCRNNPSREVVPNITINGWALTDPHIEMLKVCGSVAVSRYQPKGVCYSAVARLTKAGLKQVNIHALLSEETIDQCKELVLDCKGDPQLANLNAVLFLGLKRKGRGQNLTPVSQDRFNELVKLFESQDLKASIGFDSCTAIKYMNYAKGTKDYTLAQLFIEPCESGLFSWYINVDGVAYPCSFSEEHPEVSGINVLSANDFLKDVWMDNHTVQWRDKLIATANNNEHKCRQCPIFEV